jgi:hypothetical protein
MRIRFFIVGSLLATLCPQTWAVDLQFGVQPQEGSIASPAQSNSYTFNANANDFMTVTLVATSGKLSPRIRVYSNTGALITDGYHGGYTTRGAPPCGGGPAVAS